ncbi:hypothetical protein L6164_020601 [Bauhinia variegata]|uniref:Uncharacterized protein n=1 Tax=Bauhinia variegata TaxID=167791 RepID=A0ACB9MVJ5_BAUVA|nr:hypothetical protein L6164_020601 [Bauhinia variegata]
MPCRDLSKKMRWRRRRRQERGHGGAVEKKMKKLQRLVPGATGLNPDRLFLRTAEHILQLRLQVNVLQALANIYKP